METAELKLKSAFTNANWLYLMADLMLSAYTGSEEGLSSLTFEECEREILCRCNNRFRGEAKFGKWLSDNLDCLELLGGLLYYAYKDSKEGCSEIDIDAVEAEILSRLE